MANALSHRNIAPLAFLFEAALGLLAIGLGSWFDVDPLENVTVGPDTLLPQAVAVGWGLLATLPMLVGLVLLRQIQEGPLGELNQLVDKQLAPLFVETRIWEFALIALAAGWGEELLFRGWLQSLVTRNVAGNTGLWIGVLLGAAVFGLCHWISSTYAILALLAGIYLGILFIASGNILTSVTTHALYDFVALVWITRSPPAPTEDTSNPMKET
ncbi:MAG: CPBP family intramembrane glutamic endopeptidase [Planctomycetota bacterium]|nr:CPBP family intramembrane glutamic endopeptidase [Planctomycetota bacterium]